MPVLTIAHPSGDLIPILLDSDGLPIPEPNEFILARYTRSPNTLVRNLRELDILYKWFERQNIDLLSRVKSKGKLFSEAEIRGSLMKALREKQIKNKTSTVVSPNTFNQRLTTVRQFLVFYFDMVIYSIPSNDNYFYKANEHKKRIINLIDTSFINSPPETSGKKKGLDSDEVLFLLNILNPNNPDAYGSNPAVRYRNYISVLIMLRFGLRPGELLSLRVEDIVIGAISSINVVRRPADPNDKRNPKPRVKRNGRILSIDDSELIRSLDEYIMIYRDELEEPTKEESDYLIINDEGVPLAQDTLGSFFRLLRNKFPDDLPKNLSAKALRHTFSSDIERVLRSAGLSEDHRSQALATLRGDSSLKSQNIYIKQEIEEKAKEALINYQRKLLEGRGA